MRPDQRHLSTSHIWLYAAGLDPTALDSTGTPLAQSLATLLIQTEREGRREAAAHYLAITQSGEHWTGCDGDTGQYDTEQLNQLLKASA